MEKKTYLKPATRMTKLQYQQHLLEGSTSKVTNVSSNLTSEDAITYGGGGSGTARGRQYDCWGEEEGEE